MVIFEHAQTVDNRLSTHMKRKREPGDEARLIYELLTSCRELHRMGASNTTLIANLQTSRPVQMHFVVHSVSMWKIHMSLSRNCQSQVMLSPLNLMVTTRF